MLDGQDALSHYSREVDGTLKISAPAVFGSLHLAKLIPEFLQRWPSLQAEMVFDDKLTDLVGEGFDLAVRIGELQDSSLIARVLSPCRSVLCASPAYLAQHGTPQNLTDLKSHNCLFYSYFQAGQSWTFLHRGDVVRFTRRALCVPTTVWRCIRLFYRNGDLPAAAVYRGTGYPRRAADPAAAGIPAATASHLCGLSGS